MHWLKINVNDGVIAGWIFFNNPVDILSKPVDDLSGSELIIFATSKSFVFAKWKEQFGGLLR